ISRAAIENGSKNFQTVRRRVLHAHPERSQRIAWSACRHVCRGGTGPTERSVDKQRGILADEELAVGGKRADTNRQLVLKQSLLEPKFGEPKRLQALDIADGEKVVDALRRRTNAMNVIGAGAD